VAAVERVEVRGVTRLFGSTVALRGVSARFEAGAVTFLEGPNGAGKSTLLAVIGTFLQPSSGSVEFVRIGSDAEARRRHIGWVSHDSHCYRELTARQNVQFAARLHGVDATEGWRRAAERVGALGLAERTFGTLSRGQQQRVALARALVHSPSVLLLDEPWSGLDVSSAERLEQVLREEQERGAVVIVVSHSPALAERLASKRIRLERGRVSGG
jgi:ABC-type multidrug transport system ATPase subunit